MERHAIHLRCVVGRRVRDSSEALDVIQETSLAVWRALQHYDAGRPFEAWLTSIALNKCRDWARRRIAFSGLLSRLQTDLAADLAAVQSHGIERLLIADESVQHLGRALDRLPPQLRAPLVLTALRDRSQAAAADELGLTRKAVEMRLRRARQQLERALAS